MRNFRELKIWQRSRILAKDIYLLTEDLPSTEKFGLRSQIRRAAVSVPSNISEGSGRTTSRQFSHFLDISIGSLCEMETQVILCSDLDLLEQDNVRATACLKEIIEVRSMILGYQKRLRSDS